MILGADTGWIVETTHDNGLVETSVFLPSQAKAQAAADSWKYLDEDWAAIGAVPHPLIVKK